MRVKHFSAQSLQEYSIIFGLVVVAAIAIVFSLGENTRGLMAQDNQVLFGDGKTSLGSAGKLTRLLGDRNTRTLNLTLQDGTLITLDNYPVIDNNIQITSSEGAKDFLAVLDSLTRKLKDAGEITEDQANQLAALSNQGHRIAHIESLFEKAARDSGTDKQKFLNTTLNLDGKQYTTNELNVMLGIHGQTPGSVPLTHEMRALHTEMAALASKNANTDINQSSNALVEKVQAVDPNAVVFANDYIGEEHLKLLQQYKAVSENGSLKDPGVKAVIQNLVKQLISIQINSGVATSAIVATDPVYAKFTPDQYLKLQAANRSNQHSADICKTGGGEDTGIHCPS